MRTDINHWARTCLSCQKAKIQHHTKSIAGSFPIPSKRFERIHLDLVGPLSCSYGFSYLLATVDHFTRWPEAYPLRDISAKTVARVLFEKYISRLGVPLLITTHQGTQFESKLFHDLTDFLGAHRIRTTAYHPQSNGIVERFHRQLKAAILAKADSTT